MSAIGHVLSTCKEALIGPSSEDISMRVLAIASRVINCALFAIGIMSLVGGMPAIAIAPISIALSLASGSFSILRVTKQKNFSGIDMSECVNALVIAFIITVMGSLVISNVIADAWRMAGALMWPMSIAVLSVPLIAACSSRGCGCH